MRIDVSEGIEGGGDSMIKVVGFLGKETQHYKVYSDEGIAPTLSACDFRDPTKIVTEDRRDSDE